MLRITFILATCCIVFGNLPFVSSVRDRDYLQSIVFAKEGKREQPAELLNILVELDSIWRAPKSVLVILIQLNDVPNCLVGESYLKHANNILKDYGQFINIVEYTRYQRKLLVLKCAQEWTRSYIDSYYEMNPKVRAGTLVLKEQVRMAKEDGLFVHNNKPLYTRDALVEGVYNYMKSRPDETGKKIDKKKKVNKDEFESSYNTYVANLCSKLLYDDSSKKFMQNSTLFLEQISIEEDLVELFKYDFKDFMSRVIICLDVETSRNLSDEVYRLVKRKRERKGFFKRHSDRLEFNDLDIRWRMALNEILYHT